MNPKKTQFPKGVEVVGGVVIENRDAKVLKLDLAESYDKTIRDYLTVKKATK